MEDLTATPRDELRRALAALLSAINAVPVEGSRYASLARKPKVQSVAPVAVHSQLSEALLAANNALDALRDEGESASFPHIRAAIETGVTLRYLTGDPRQLYTRFLLVLDADWRRQHSAKVSPFGDAYKLATGEEPPARYWAVSGQLKNWAENNRDKRAARELADTWMLLSAYQHGSILTEMAGDEVQWDTSKKTVDLGMSIWSLAELVSLCARQIETAKGRSGSL